MEYSFLILPYFSPYFWKWLTTTSVGKSSSMLSLSIDFSSTTFFILGGIMALRSEAGNGFLLLLAFQGFDVLLVPSHLWRQSLHQSVLGWIPPPSRPLLIIDSLFPGFQSSFSFIRKYALKIQFSSSQLSENVFILLPHVIDKISF